MKQLKAPMLSTGFAESGAGEKKRFDFILNGGSGKRGVWLFCVLLAFAVLAGCTFAFHSENTPKSVEQADLDKAISEYFISDNGNRYLHSECVGEGHILLGTEEKDGKTIAYLLTMYGEYGFQNGKFVKTSGSGCIPAVMTLSLENGSYKGKDVQYPMDGSYYADSIKKMFPAQYWVRTLSPREKDYKALKAQEKAYAEAYLNKIGRKTEVCEYADLNTVILTDLGVSVDTSNALMGNELLYGYPYWIGTEEKTEDGVRYVYELQYDSGKKHIIYTKYPYQEPDNLIEKFVFDESGTLIENLSTPVSK